MNRHPSSCQAQAATPVGLSILFGRFPRVARASQPWAGGPNPIGIGNGQGDDTLIRLHTYSTENSEEPSFRP